MSEHKITYITGEGLEGLEESLKDIKLPNYPVMDKNLLFLHYLVVCPSCGIKARIKMEAID